MSENNNSNERAEQMHPTETTGDIFLHTHHERHERSYSLMRRTAYILGETALVAALIFATPGQLGIEQTVIPPSSTSSPEPTPEKTTVPEVKTHEQAYFNDKFAKDAEWTQDFSETSNGTLDQKNWNILVGPPPANQEAEYYTDSPNNLRIENGALVLEARQEAMKGYNYTSARIDTLGKQDFMYGKVEVTAKLPAGVGTWPAIWLLSSENKYANQPIPAHSNQYYVDGEIDMVEAIGSQPNTVYGIGHALLNPDHSSYPGVYYATTNIPDASTAFHTYGLDWTPTNLTFTVDGKPYYSVDKGPNDDYKRWPYDQKYHLIINLALGGSWAGRETKAYPPDGVDKNSLPAQLQIKSINYFPLAQ